MVLTLLVGACAHTEPPKQEAPSPPPSRPEVVLEVGGTKSVSFESEFAGALRAEGLDVFGESAEGHPYRVSVELEVFPRSEQELRGSKVYSVEVAVVIEVRDTRTDEIHSFNHSAVDARRTPEEAERVAIKRLLHKHLDEMVEQVRGVVNGG